MQNVFFKSFVFAVGFCVLLPQCLAKQVLFREGVVGYQLNAIRDVETKIPDLMKQFKIPGVAIALVDQHGVVWAQAFGLKNNALKKPVTLKTIFSVQSISKVFTSLLAFRAAEAGYIKLDKPINVYLKTLKLNSIYEKKPENIITVTNLLSHTAGFSHEAPLGNNYQAGVSFNTHMQSILTDGLWLKFKVGAGYSYSNVGIDLAGYIVEKAVGESFVNVMDDFVLKSLAMNDSSFNYLKVKNAPNYLPGYIAGFEVVPVNTSFIPSGGMYSTVMDLAHYVQFQLNGGVYKKQKILSTSLLNKMLSIPYSRPGQSTGSAMGLWKGRRLNTIYYAHLGRGFGNADNLEWYPEYHLGVIVLTNNFDRNNVDIKISHLVVDPIIQTIKKNQLKHIRSVISGNYISDSSKIRISTSKNSDNILVSGVMGFDTARNILKPVSIVLEYKGNNHFYSKKLNEEFLFKEHGITGMKTLVRLKDAAMWFYNDSKKDSIGPEKRDWKLYTGVYSLKSYGGDVKKKVHIKNGYLYFNDIRLHQSAGNVFYMPAGEIVTFTKGKCRWANLLLMRS